MVTREQFINGIIEYTDNEVIPNLPVAGKWSVGSFMLIAQTRANYILNELSNNQLFNMLGIIDSNGKIDVETLSNVFCESATKYGKLEITIPLLGSMTFSEEDVSKLYSYITGGN